MTDNSIIEQLRRIGSQFNNLADNISQDNEEEEKESFEYAEQAAKTNAKSGF